ncbi:MAG: hypothetical protein AB1779_03250 [Candidatus Thermoplasmatota archaeon]
MKGMIVPVIFIGATGAYVYLTTKGTTEEKNVALTYTVTEGGVGLVMFAGLYPLVAGLIGTGGKLPL